MLLKNSPELTVCILQEGSPRHLGDALESVLQQDSIDFEVLLVASADLDLCLPSDSRLSVLPKTSRRVGVAYNAALRHSSAPYFAIVGSSDVVLPGAFRRMTDLCKSSQSIGMTHCLFHRINESGSTTRERARAARENCIQMKSEGFDLKRELLVRGFFLSYFRVFRREAIESCAGFDSLTDFADLVAALKIADRYEIRLIPEYLYSRRITKAQTRWQELWRWRRRYSTVRTLRRKVRFLNDRQYESSRWRRDSLLQALRIDVEKSANTLKQKISLKQFRARITNLLYYSLVCRLHWWPLDWSSQRRPKKLIPGGGIAYYTWHFPVFSQTFVHREMDALCKGGLSLYIVAEEREDPDLADEKARTLLQNTSYLLPMDSKSLSGYLKYFFFRKPLTAFNLLVFLLTHRYSRFKSLPADWIVFCKAVYFAGLLKGQNIRHIHSPWADESAVIALMASRLLNVSFSVQARAHEIHREFFQFAFLEVFPRSDFLITNTRYNANHIHSLLKNPNGNKIITIYNGLDLGELQPSRKTEPATPITLLSVARLIEQKGLIYLLKACRNLMDRGYQFRCEIVGCPEKELYMDYYVSLMKIHRQLNLSESVEFTGALSFENVRKKYREADVFILPCVIAGDGSRDIIPNSLLEAMAMKLPVISTNIVAIPEIVEDGISGFLVPPADEEALTNVIVRLINDPALRASIGENARKRVEEKFDMAKNIKQYAQLFVS